MINFPSASDALRAYSKSHHSSREVFMDWTPMPVAAFKEWVERADLTKPCGDVKL